MCLAEGYNAVTLVRLKPAIPWSGVKYSTTEPPSSHILDLKILKLLGQTNKGSNEGDNCIQNLHLGR